MRRFSLRAQPLAVPLTFFAFSTSAIAHEAWLLTPDEIIQLSEAPVPELFRSQLWLGLAAVLGFGVTAVCLKLEPIIEAIETRVIAPFAEIFPDIAPVLIRLGLSVMLILAAFGGLPRHGTEIWAVSTFLVPDMQLSDGFGDSLLIATQIILGAMLLLGWATRVAGAAIVLLAVAGPMMFGLPFLSYSLHFAAPGVLLMAFGGGRFSVDAAFQFDTFTEFTSRNADLLYRFAQVMVGVGFVYLGVAYKLLQPTLLIAILEHGNMPTFGVPMPLIALVMTGVEIICGALLIAGRLIRPVSVAILGAITFLAIVLAETPLFHANLYGTLACFLLLGRTLRATPPVLVPSYRRIAS